MKKVLLSLAAVSALMLMGCDDSKKEEVKSEVTQSVKSVVDEGAKKINNAVDDAANKITENIAPIVEKAEPIINQVVANASENISETSKNVANTLKESTNEVANAIKENADNLAQAISVDNASKNIESALSVDGATLFKKCVACHGKKAEKLAPGAEIIINTLSEQEIYEALSGYKAGTFGGKSQKTMQLQVKNLKDEDFKALAKYIKTL